MFHDIKLRHFFDCCTTSFSVRSYRTGVKICLLELYSQRPQLMFPLIPARSGDSSSGLNIIYTAKYYKLCPFRKDFSCLAVNLAEAVPCSHTGSCTITSLFICLCQGRSQVPELICFPPTKLTQLSALCVFEVLTIQARAWALQSPNLSGESRYEQNLPSGIKLMKVKGSQAPSSNTITLGQCFGEPALLDFIGVTELLLMPFLKIKIIVLVSLCIPWI